MIKTSSLGGGHVRTTLTGVEVSGTEKVWKMFQAIGDIAFAYAFSNVLIEIQASTRIYYLSIYSLVKCSVWIAYNYDVNHF